MRYEYTGYIFIKTPNRLSYNPSISYCLIHSTSFFFRKWLFSIFRAFLPIHLKFPFLAYYLVEMAIRLFVELLRNMARAPSWYMIAFLQCLYYRDGCMSQDPSLMAQIVFGVLLISFIWLFFGKGTQTKFCERNTLYYKPLNY
jgi:hypothetical protein